jgi:hypothetical protein
MSPLSFEWTLWSLINGVPALIATLAFLFYAPFDRFAWDIEDRRSGIFLGTGFLLRMTLFVQVITAKSWGEIRWLTYGNAVFAAVLLLVTLIWGDRFKWSRPIAIIWLFLYIEEPVWMFTLVPQAQAAAGAAVAPGGVVLPFTQIVLFIEAAVMLVAGLTLLFMDRITNPLWPWQPDHISARIMAGFPLAWVVWALTLGLAPTWGEARGGVLVSMVWLAAMLVSVLVFRSRFELGRRTTQLYLAVIAVLLIAQAATYFTQGA